MTNKIKISRELVIRCEQVAHDAGFVQLAYELSEILAAPVVERQEPFAMFEVGEDGEHGVLITDRELLKELKAKRQHYFTHLYTSPPAPVPVVLPQRMYSLLPGADYWNACIDKVKELNQ